MRTNRGQQKQTCPICEKKVPSDCEEKKDSSHFLFIEKSNEEESNTQEKNQESD